METKKDLPYEIIEDILLRLPVKSLQRSKCVCKKWYALISDPQFARIHLRRPQTQGRTRLCIVNSHERTDVNVVGNVNDDKGELIEFDCLLTDIKNIMKSTLDGCILNSCDGLFCLIDSCRRIVLWNPSIRQYNYLPSNPNNANRRNNDCFRTEPGYYGYFVDGYKLESFYGFGYDSCSDDYKLLAGYFWDYDNNTRIDMFSLKSNDWKSISILHEKYHVTILYEKGVFLRGAAHWIISCYSSSFNPVILAFDFEKEEFKEMAIPIKNLYGPRLMVIEGCLCAYDSHKYPSEKWVMKDYGVEASWTKMASPRPYPSQCQLVDALNDQHLLLINEEKVVMWDHKENLEKNVMTYENLLQFETNFFIETLVSPYSSVNLGHPSFEVIEEGNKDM